jgi:hypothetical protein
MLARKDAKQHQEHANPVGPSPVGPAPVVSPVASGASPVPVTSASH